MGRMYSINFGGSAQAAAFDLFEIIGASNKIVRLHEIKIAQSTEAGDASSEQLRVTLSRFTGAYTSGSGGSSATPRPLDPGDAAATLTAEVTNTTQATGGTSVQLVQDAFNVMAGWHYLPTPECRPVLAASSALVLAMASTPADSITFSGYAIVEEIG